MYSEKSLLTKEIIFTLDSKSVLNSNHVIKHYMSKANKVAFLRDLAANQGIVLHNDVSGAKLFYQAVKNKRDLIASKKRNKKRLADNGCDESEIEQHLKRVDESIDIADMPNVVPLFDVFKVLVTVFPPTKRRLDPVNLYPTVKALIDGLTDAAWWKDDDFSHLTEITFRYGGVCDEKGLWKIALKVTELSDSEMRLINV